MKSNWKKFYHANGTTEVWPDGKKPPDFKCLVIPAPEFTLTAQTFDVLMSREQAERFVKARPDIFRL